MPRSELAQRVNDAQQRLEAGGSGTIYSLVTSPKMAAQIGQALPRGMDSQRFVRVVATELRRNPQLMTTTPQSFIGALLEAAALGLEPGPLGHCYLLPFRDRNNGTTECQLILGYKGLIAMARRSGTIKNIIAREVCENDTFNFEYGLKERLQHVPLMDGDRGKPVSFYGVAKYKGGGHLIMVLSKADVDKYRARSRARNSGPWVTDYTAMALKTVIRRMATFMPLSVQAAEAVAIDEQRELGIDPGITLTVEPAQVVERAADAPADPVSVEEAQEAEQEQADSADGADGTQAELL